MARTLAVYNGWPGFVRDARYTQAKKEGLVKKKPTACELCGSDTPAGNYMPHAEEYGSTFAMYRRFWVNVCCRCHGMIHVRHRFPNRFNLYTQKVAEGLLYNDLPYNTMPAFFGAVNSWEDYGQVSRATTGVPFLDSLSLQPYTGLPKLATVELGGHIFLDPAVYPRGVPQHGVVLLEDMTTLETCLIVE